MRNQRSFHRAAALLRQGMALSVAVALVCSLALSSAALEVDVLNETTGLVESVDLDEDAAQPEEDLPAASDADEEPEETPTEETEEAPADADEDTSKTDAEETPTEDNEEKSEDTSKADDTDDAAPDDDFLFVDDSTDEADDAFSVDYYADSTAPQETGVYYYYNGKSGDSTTSYSYGDANKLGDTIRHGFYNSDNTLTHVTDTDETTTMESFITNHPSATIHMVTGYILNSGKSETWDCANITLQRAQNYRAIEIEGGTLTLKGNLKLEQSGSADGAGASIRVVSGGTLDLYDDVTIEGLKCTSGKSGGIIYMERGTVNMYGGTLSNSALSGSSARGGAVYLNDTSSIFNMSGGVIKDASSQDGGGGVYVAHGTFNMSGGTITGNTSSANGGGVYVNGGTFTMSGGTIEKNNSTSGGGGVYVTGAGSKFTMSGGTITGNTSGTNGGGVFLENGTFEMTGGTIENNAADGDGGGVSVTNGTFILNGGSIENNVAGASDGMHYGGGIKIAGGTVTISGGIITGNQCGQSSAISIPSGSLTISGGTIADNINTGSGEPNEVSIALPITINGGSIKGINYKNHPEHILDGQNNQLTEYIVNVGSSEGILVSSSDITITDAKGNPVTSYGFNDMYTDSAGNVYLWLPADYTVTYGAGTVPEPTKTYKALIKYTNSAGLYETVGESVPANTELTAEIEMTGTSQSTETETYSLAMYSEDAGTTTKASNVINGMTYQWQYADRQDASEAEWTDLADATQKTYTTTGNALGSWVRVVITRTTTTTSGTTSKEYPSAAVWVEVPQMSVTVPMTLTVIVAPDGNCTFASNGFNVIETDSSTTVQSADIATYAAPDSTAFGTIANNSSSAITLNSVTFTWNDEAQNYFTNWGASKPTIKLGGDSGTASGNALTWTLDTLIASGGSADLQWSFSLNGNAISQKLQADTKASIGTITYTVSFADTASGGDSTTTTRAPGTPVVF